MLSYGETEGGMKLFNLYALFSFPQIHIQALSQSTCLLLTQQKHAIHAVDENPTQSTLVITLDCGNSELKI